MTYPDSFMDTLIEQLKSLKENPKYNPTIFSDQLLAYQKRKSNIPNEDIDYLYDRSLIELVKA